MKRGLVESPEQWRWSSYRFYLLEEAGLVRVNVGWGEISLRDRAGTEWWIHSHARPSQRTRKDGAPTRLVAPARSKAWAIRPGQFLDPAPEGALIAAFAACPDTNHSGRFGVNRIFEKDIYLIADYGLGVADGTGWKL